jgi:hypothetical protein
MLRNVPDAMTFSFYFLPALIFAHRALCAAAILLRPAGEIVRFLRVVLAAFGLLPLM